MLLDTSTHVWTIRYANFAVCHLTGLDMPLVDGEDLWSLFGVEEVVSNRENPERLCTCSVWRRHALFLSGVNEVVGFRCGLGGGLVDESTIQCHRFACSLSDRGPLKSQGGEGAGCGMLLAGGSWERHSAASPKVGSPIMAVGLAGQAWHLSCAAFCCAVPVRWCVDCWCASL